MKNNAKFINNAVIEGYLYSLGDGFNELSERETGETSKNPGTKYIGGEIDIAVDEEGLNIVTIHYTYVTETYKSGKPNNSYSVLKKLIEEKPTWLEVGKENAAKVKCTSVSLTVNDFIAQDGSKVAALRNEGGFISIVKEFGSENKRNEFQTDMLINRIKMVEDDDEHNVKAHGEISGYIFGYGPKIMPVTFNIYNPNGIAYFEDLNPSNKEPVFTKVWGHINSNVVKIEKTEESAFGEAVVRTFTSKRKEYLITGTAKIPYDFGNDDVLTPEDVGQMMQDREVLLAEIQKRFDEKGTTAPANNAFAAATAPTTSATPIKNSQFKF